MDAVIVSALDARRLLEEALDDAKAYEAAPKVEVVLKKISVFRDALEKAAGKVERSWQGIGSAISELRGREMPSTWHRLKVLFSQEDPPQSNLTGAETAVRLPRATAALEAFRSELLRYCDEWETPLRGILAGVESQRRKPDPPSQAELMQQHFDLLHGKKK